VTRRAVATWSFYLGAATAGLGAWLYLRGTPYDALGCAAFVIGVSAHIGLVEAVERHERGDER
jgi:hypothetical protein